MLKKTIIICALVSSLWHTSYGMTFAQKSAMLSGKTLTHNLIPSIDKTEIKTDGIKKVEQNVIADLGANLKELSEFHKKSNEKIYYSRIIDKVLPRYYEYKAYEETKEWKRGNHVYKVIPLKKIVDYHTDEIELRDPETDEHVCYLHGVAEFDPITEKYKLYNIWNHQVYFDEKVPMTIWYDAEQNKFVYYDEEVTGKKLGEATGTIDYDIGNRQKVVYKPNGEEYQKYKLNIEIKSKHEGEIYDKELQKSVYVLDLDYHIDRSAMTVEYFTSSDGKSIAKHELYIGREEHGHAAYFDRTNGIFIESVQGGEVGPV